MSKPIGFQEIAKLSVFGKFASVAQKAFGVTIALIKPDTMEGLLLGPPEGLNPFCKLLSSDHQGLKLCLTCDYLHQQEAKKTRKSVHYTCHAGLIDFIIPIFYGSDIIAYLQCGQVLDKKPSTKGWKRIKTLFQGYKIDMKKLKHYYYNTRVLKTDVLQGLIELLEIFANYITDAGLRLLMQEKDRKSQIVFYAENHIKNHLCEPLTLDDIARASFTSKRSLTRIFAMETNMTVLDYVNKAKIARACELLADDSIKISTAAFDCGFGSIQQFNRLFKQVKGATPRQWRKKPQGPPPLFRS
ncbi:MAG: PocR ligand-binding domain-containing protein [Fibrobacterota bacterium]